MLERFGEGGKNWDRISLQRIHQKPLESVASEDFIAKTGNDGCRRRWAKGSQKFDKFLQRKSG
jgi:hypothetical protein